MRPTDRADSGGSHPRPPEDTALSTVGAAYKLSDEWTALGKNLYSVVRNRAAADKLDDWLQLGLAYRESDANRVNGLLRAGSRHERVANRDGVDAVAESAGFGATANSRRDVAVVSTHRNVQPSAWLLLSGRVAAKWANESSLGIGWNAFGFVDKDLSAPDYTKPGVYLRLRWKFDEALLRRATE